MCFNLCSVKTCKEEKSTPICGCSRDVPIVAVMILPSRLTFWRQAGWLKVGDAVDALFGLQTLWGKPDLVKSMHRGKT